MTLSPHPRTRAPSERALRVMLAEDHPVLREVLAELLRGEPGLEVVGLARDGCEAVEMAGRVRPDVILMDLTMPKMDGIEATRRIVAVMPLVCVIGLSMHETSDAAAALRAVGAVAYVRKADAMELLVATIERCARGKTAAAV